MTFLKLAYIAEFGVAFNLAFGEFKHESTSKTINESFASIDKIFKGNSSLTAIYDVRDKNSRYHTTSDTLHTKNLKRLDNLRSSRSQSGNLDYKPLQSFWERVLLFSTHPKHIQSYDEEPSSTWLKLKKFLNRHIADPISYLFRLPPAFLVSWAYSKNPNWSFSSCKLAVLLWSVAIILFLLIAYSGPNFDIEWGDSRFNYVLHNWHYSFFGAMVAVLAPRPLSFFMAGFLGRKAIPRGRYYAAVLTVLIILSVLVGTYLDAKGFYNNETWWFCFGFLTIAAIHPILLFGGYHALESVIASLVKWVEAESNILRTKSLEGISQYINETRNNSPSTPRKLA